MADVGWVWILLRPASTLGPVLLVLMAKAQEVMLNLTSTFQAAAYVISANLPLDKASQMGMAEVKGGGSISCKEMQSPRAREYGYREGWQVRATNSAYLVLHLTSPI